MGALTLGSFASVTFDAATLPDGVRSYNIQEPDDSQNQKETRSGVTYYYRNPNTTFSARRSSNIGYYTKFNQGTQNKSYAEGKNKDYYSSKYNLKLGDDNQNNHLKLRFIGKTKFMIFLNISYIFITFNIVLFVFHYSVQF